MKRTKGIITSAGLWLLFGVLLVSGVGLLWKGYTARGERIQELEQQVSDLQSLADTRAESISNLTKANDANYENVLDLRERLESAIGQNRATEQRITEARQALAASKRAAAMALDALRHDREKTYVEHDDCRAWADQPVCPAIAERLREQWSQAGAGDGPPIGFSRGAGSAVRADPGRAD